jgi:hypothetical protein
VIERTEEFQGLADQASGRDLSTPESVVLALYEAISGPQGVERDWDLLRALFDTRARFLIGRWREESGQFRDAVCEWDLDGFIEEGRAFWLEDGFWETQLVSRTESYGNVAHVFSSYESRIGAETSDPVGRGINSIQLLKHAGRWWITGIVWDIETEENRIPDALTVGGQS